MTRLVRVSAIALPVLAIATVTLHADLKERERSSVHFESGLINFFAGKAAKEGIEDTTVVKGDRKATLNDSTGKIIDLKEEKVYDLDLKKKTYKVTTFDELRRQMREQEQKAEQNAQKEQGGQQAQPQKPDKEYEVDFDVKDTGQKKQIAGFDTHETIVTITVRQKGMTLEDGGGVVMTNDMWLGPKVPQTREVADFDLRYWRALEGPEMPAISAEQMATVMAMYPGVKSAMERFSKDGDKLSGTPLDTTSTFEGVKSKDQMAQEQQQPSQTPSTPTGLGGMLAKRMMKKNDNSGPKQRATFMTLHHEILEITPSATDADVAIPPDFREKK